MKDFFKRMAAKLGRDCNESESECEPAIHGGRVDEGAAKDGCDTDTGGGGETTACGEERVKGRYQICPMSSYNGGRCIFAMWDFGVLHCYYGGDTVIEKKVKGGVVVEQPNVMCPKKAIWSESKRRKIEKLKYGEAMKALAEVEKEK
jgi:hypothetical protein